MLVRLVQRQPDPIRAQGRTAMKMTLSVIKADVGWRDGRCVMRK
jgi:hypothetical protein